jgi:hypothetical protein
MPTYVLSDVDHSITRVLGSNDMNDESVPIASDVIYMEYYMSDYEQKEESSVIWLIA